MRPIALALIALVALNTAGCDPMRRLSGAERDHFDALKVFMNEDQRKDWLKLKTEEERNNALKAMSMWDVYYKYDDKMRSDIQAGLVKVGWDEKAVYMSWGRPYEKLSITGRQAELSQELQYRFEVNPYGDVVVWTPKSKTEHSAAALYTVQLTIDDGRVARMVRTDCVPNWNYCNDIKWTKGE